MLIAHLRFLLFDFKYARQRKPGERSGRHSSSTGREGAVLQHASCRTRLVFILVQDPGNGMCHRPNLSPLFVLTEHRLMVCIASESYTGCRKIFVNLKGLGQNYNGRTQVREHYTNDNRG